MFHPHWKVLLEPPYPSILLTGVWITVLLALISSVASFFLGVMLAVGRASGSRTARIPCTFFCDIVRSLPGVFWLLLFFFCLPVLLPEGAGLALNGWDGFPFFAACLGLSVNNSPYIADILYSVMGVSGKNAMDAARLAGLRGAVFWCRVVLPQAVAASLAAISIRMLHNFKNTSLAMVISVPELTWASQEVESLSFAGLEVTTAATCIYLAMGGVLSLLLHWLRSSVRRRCRLEG